jgi:hypothetical protein
VPRLLDFSPDEKTMFQGFTEWVQAAEIGFTVDWSVLHMLVAKYLHRISESGLASCRIATLRSRGGGFSKIVKITGSKRPRSQATSWHSACAITVK